MLVYVAIEKLVPVLDRASNQQYMHCTTQCATQLCKRAYGVVLSVVFTDRMIKCVWPKMCPFSSSTFLLNVVQDIR